MISSMQIKKYRAQLRELSEKPLPEGRNQKEAEHRLIMQYRDFSPDKTVGQKLCESYTDEELIAILKEAFDRLGRAPVQSDIFCFYRTYIKHRFVTWTAALKTAGLSRALDNRTNILSVEEYEKIEREEPQIRALLIRLAERWTELGYPPKRKEFPENAVLKHRFESWGDVLHVAEGFEAWQQVHNEKTEWNFTPEEALCLQELKEMAEKLDRTPLKKEICEETRCRLRICCGSWDAVLREAELKPLRGNALEQAQRDERQRQAANDSLFIITDLEPEYGALLKEIKALAENLGRAPLKEETDADKRRKLQERCGSWRNALYQIGVAALTKQETSKIKKKKRDMKGKNGYQRETLCRYHSG